MSAQPADAVPAACSIGQAIEQVDRLVARMPAELRDVIVLDQQRDLPMKAMASRLHASPGEVRRLREHAYGWMAGALTFVDSPR